MLAASNLSRHLFRTSSLFFVWLEYIVDCFFHCVSNNTTFFFHAQVPLVRSCSCERAVKISFFFAMIAQTCLFTICLCCLSLDV